MRKLIAIMDELKDGKCISVGCRHKMMWQESAEQKDVCQKCIEAVKNGTELSATIEDDTGEIWVSVPEIKQ